MRVAHDLDPRGLVGEESSISCGQLVGQENSQAEHCRMKITKGCRVMKSTLTIQASASLQNDSFKKW